MDPEVQSANKPFYCNINCQIQIVFVPENPLERKMFYLACPVCRKKVVDDSMGYRCENCAKTQQEATPTYNFGLKIADCSGELVLNCLGEAGESILGMKANDFYEIHEDIERVRSLATSLQMKEMTMCLRGKLD